MKVGMRKFTITVLSILSFTAIMILGQYAIDPTALGLGIGLLVTPSMAGYVGEWMSKRSVK